MNQAAMHVDADYRWRYVWVRVIGYAVAASRSLRSRFKQVPPHKNVFLAFHVYTDFYESGRYVYMDARWNSVGGIFGFESLATL